MCFNHQNTDKVHLTDSQLAHAVFHAVLILRCKTADLFFPCNFTCCFIDLMWPVFNSLHSEAQHKIRQEYFHTLSRNTNDLMPNHGCFLSKKKKNSSDDQGSKRSELWPGPNPFGPDKVEDTHCNKAQYEAEAANTQQGSKHRQHEKWQDPIKFNYSSCSFILTDNFD